MELLSPAFDHEHHIPVEHSVDGAGTLPVLELVDVPTAAKSIALLVHDPDVPRDRRPDGNFDHWVVWNISPDTRSITSIDDHDGVVGANTLGANAYVPPAPPPGTGEHRYFFNAYALDCALVLPPSSTRADVEVALAGHVLAQAQLMGRFSR